MRGYQVRWKKYDKVQSYLIQGGIFSIFDTGGNILNKYKLFPPMMAIGENWSNKKFFKEKKPESSHVAWQNIL